MVVEFAAGNDLAFYTSKLRKIFANNSPRSRSDVRITLRATGGASTTRLRFPDSAEAVHGMAEFVAESIVSASKRYSEGLEGISIEFEPDIMTFHNERDVIKFEARRVVPPHGERVSLDGELWILGRYLRALAAAKLLTYPFTVTHAREGQSPDFTIAWPDGTMTGLEATEACTPRAHLLYKKSEHAKGNAVLVGDEPAIGDAPEREWADNVNERMRVKADGRSSGRWTLADPCELVLYDNGAADVAVDLPGALSKLHDLLALQPPTGFRNVSIIADSFSRLIYLEGDNRDLPIPPK